VRIPEEFVNHINWDAEGGCWLWSSAKNRRGYGRARLCDNNQQAHNIVYKLLVGPIPQGLILDHLCTNPSCVNPSHLQPINQCENVRRYWKIKRRKAN
jgi:hypothetical protein